MHDERISVSGKEMISSTKIYLFHQFPFLKRLICFFPSCVCRENTILNHCSYLKRMCLHTLGLMDRSNFYCYVDIFCFSRVSLRAKLTPRHIEILLLVLYMILRSLKRLHPITTCIISFGCKLTNPNYVFCCVQCHFATALHHLSLGGMTFSDESLP